MSNAIMTTKPALLVQAMGAQSFGGVSAVFAECGYEEVNDEEARATAGCTSSEYLLIDCKTGGLVRLYMQDRKWHVTPA